LNYAGETQHPTIQNTHPMCRTYHPPSIHYYYVNVACAWESIAGIKSCDLNFHLISAGFS